MHVACSCEWRHLEGSEVTSVSVNEVPLVKFIRRHLGVVVLIKALVVLGQCLILEDTVEAFRGQLALEHAAKVS